MSPIFKQDFLRRSYEDSYGLIISSPYMVHFILGCEHALPACSQLFASDCVLSSPAQLQARRPEAEVQNQVHFGQASAFPSMQHQRWSGLACAVQMTANTYVCFYSTAFQRAGCKEVHAHFLFVWPKIRYLRAPGNLTVSQNMPF